MGQKFNPHFCLIFGHIYLKFYPSVVGKKYIKTSHEIEQF